MNSSPVDSVQNVFRALSDPTRRQILIMLEQRDMTIAEITGCFPMTRAAVKKHLTILEEGGLVSARAAGRERFNSLNPRSLKLAADWIAYFSSYWDDRLAALKDTVERGAKSNGE